MDPAGRSAGLSHGLCRFHLFLGHSLAQPDAAGTDELGVADGVRRVALATGRVLRGRICARQIMREDGTMSNAQSLAGATLLITGGTGSFGNAVLQRFIDAGLREIRVFSRDEKKQDDMRKRYNNANLKFYIGDVRDERSVNGAMRGVDYVF